MIRRRFVVLVFCLAMSLQGCAALLIGTAGVVGGMATSEDTVQSDVDAKYEQVWNITLNEIEKMGGAINVQERSRGLIEAKVRGAQVAVAIDSVTDRTIRIKVKSRKNYLPNIKLAHELSARILKKL